MLGISAPLMEGILRMPPSALDMQRITIEEAKAIYMVHFWLPIRGKEIENQGISTMFLDGVVNHGLGLGVRLMQRALGIRADGIVGPVTIGAINAADARQLVQAYAEQRSKIYANHPNASSFLAGWMNRINKFLNQKDEIA